MCVYILFFMNDKMGRSMFRNLFRWVALLGIASWCSFPTIAEAQTGDPDWRTWTSADGAKIEAYLREVRDGSVVIVRRDGKEFVAPLDRFSVEDRQFVAEQAQKDLPSAAKFNELDFTKPGDTPRKFQIENVPHVRARSKDPIGAAAVQMVLEFHELPVPPNLTDLMQSLVQESDQPVSARGIQNVLQHLPVEMVTLTHVNPDEKRRREDNAAWEANKQALRTALTWNLPVIVSYRLSEGIEAAATTVVAVGYDARSLKVLDAHAGRSPVSIDFELLDFRFSYGLILFPKLETVVPPPPTAEPQLDRQFLSSVSKTIQGAPIFSPEAITTALEEAGLRPAMRDINRKDLENSLGQTRSFARSGGLQFVDASLRNGNVVVLPQELSNDGTPSFLLIYGQAADSGYYTVQFNPDRPFDRGVLTGPDIANRWITRIDHLYRLDLIEVPIPAAPETTQPETTPPAQPRQ